MNDYLISTTSTCDLTKDLLDNRKIEYAKFKMIIDGKTYEDNFYNDYPYEDFFNGISQGLMPTTSQIGFGVYEEYFNNLLKQKKNILHICLSSALSGDYNTAKSVADELNENNDNKIYVIDSLAVSSGYGMLVLMADDNKNNGMSLEDNIKYLEDNKLKIQHWGYSSDLSSYIRGGRISKATGFFGTALKICPLLNMTKDGALIPVEKIRTKTKAIQTLIDKMAELADDGLNYNGRVFLCCSMCEDDATILKNLILDKFKNIKDVELFKIGSVLGCHSGPGTLAIFFVGAYR